LTTPSSVATIHRFSTRHAASGDNDAGITNGIEFDEFFDLARMHCAFINALALGGSAGALCKSDRKSR